MADMYICKRILDGRDKDICDEQSDCLHASPHERCLVTNHIYCDAYGSGGPCDVCVIKPEEWDK
jgi:hypothetical protein